MSHSDNEIVELKAQLARLEERLTALERVRAGGTIAVAPAAIPPPPVILPPPLMTSVPVVSAVPKKPGRDIPSIFWVAGAGAVIFLIGVIYLFAVSIQMGWISPAVRMVFGLFAAGALGYVAARLLRGSSRTLGVIILAASLGTWQFSLFYGSHWAFLFAPLLGLAGSVIATVLAGGVAARIRSGAALAVAVAAGLVAPLVFSDGSGNIPGLLGYLIALTAAQVAVFYLVRTGAQWIGVRLIAAIGTWFVVLSGALTQMHLEDAWIVAGLGLGLHAVLLLLFWLPRHVEKPLLPAAATAFSQICLALVFFTVIDRRMWDTEWFAVPLVLLAISSLAMVGPARRRTGGRGNDLTLLLLTVGFAVVAVPVAVDRAWVAVSWAVMAVLLGLGERQLRVANNPSSTSLFVLTLVVSTIATFAWIDAAWIYHSPSRLIFVNPGFISGALTTLAWGLLMQQPRVRGLFFAVFQFVAINTLAWELWRRVGTMHGEGLYFIPLGLLLATLVYAVAGAAQWLRGVILGSSQGMAKWLRVAGYCWLGFAGLKLLFYDLSGSNLIMRALAALGMGAVMIVAALWANSHRAKTEKKQS